MWDGASIEVVFSSFPSLITELSSSLFQPLFLSTALLVLSGWLEVRLMVLWRCVLGDSGEQSVMTPGPTAVLELCANSWDYQVTVCGGLGELYVP